MAAKDRPDSARLSDFDTLMIRILLSERYGRFALQNDEAFRDSGSAAGQRNRRTIPIL